MDVREKLVEMLLKEDDVCKPNECKDCGANGSCYYHRAANRIIANGVTVQKWIPVTERLPEEDGKYLVFEQGNGRTVTSVLKFAKDARKVDRYDFKGRWKNAWYEYDSEWGYYTVNSVTHWMPLPEPPKD